MSNPIPPHVLAAIGLGDPGAEMLDAAPAATWRLPDALASRAQGLAHSQPEGPERAQAVLDDWDPEEVALDALDPVRLSFWRRNPQVLVVEPGPAEVFSTVPLEPLDEELFFLELQPGSPQGLLFETPERRFLVEAGPGEVRVFELPTARRPTPAPQAATRLEPPDLRRLLGDERLDAALFEEAEARAATGSPYEVCAAVGWVTGLWRAAPRAGLDALLEVAEWPPARALAWAESLDAEGRRAIVSAALDEADRLTHALDDLTAAVASEAPEASSAARGWLRDRQTLAEVRRVLGPHGRDLDATLTALDDATRSHAEVFFALEALLDDDVLAIAAAKDPDAPWLRIAGS